MGRRNYDPDFQENSYEYSNFCDEIKRCTSKPSMYDESTRRLHPENPTRSCETRELIKNGSFETPDPLSNNPFNSFADWTITQTVGQITVGISTPANEGQSALQFFSSTSNTPSFKSATVSQNVFVTPGCYYRLRFGENFIQRGINAGTTPRLVARVFYTRNGNQYNLINIPVAKFDGPGEVNKGYSFHEAVTEIAVPCGVAELTVEFRFIVTDTVGTEWLVDSVSLRAVSSTSTC